MVVLKDIASLHLASTELLEFRKQLKSLVTIIAQKLDLLFLFLFWRQGSERETAFDKFSHAAFELLQVVLIQLLELPLRVESFLQLLHVRTVCFLTNAAHFQEVGTLIVEVWHNVLQCVLAKAIENALIGPHRTQSFRRFFDWAIKRRKFSDCIFFTTQHAHEVLHEHALI